MIRNETVANLVSQLVRTVDAEVDVILDGSTSATFSDDDKIKSIKIERFGEESKFFGFGIMQKANVHLIDPDRELDFNTSNSMKIRFAGVQNAPELFISEIHRDETTNELSITAYDKIKNSSEVKITELDVYGVEGGYTVMELAESCARKLGLKGVRLLQMTDESFQTAFPNGANVGGQESIRDMLDDISEVTCSIYFLTPDNYLAFKRLNNLVVPDLYVDTEKYYTFDSSTNRRLAKIYHCTELGDDIFAETEASGSTQYVRYNTLWSSLTGEEIGALLNDAIAVVGGLTIGQFTLEKWRGSPLLEPCDKIRIHGKGLTYMDTYLLDDTITYDNTGYHQTTKWNYTDNFIETAENSSLLGDVLNQTFARVDKVNQTIDLVASTAEANSSEIAALQINTRSISASVEEVQKNVEGAIEGIEGDIDTITKRVEQTMTAEAVTTTIKTILEQDGVTKVITTSSRFDEDGLTIFKSGSELETTMSHDGLVINRDDMEVLRVDNRGVNAANLHATTYLIVGLNSRFEDYDNNTRTGCFWIS